MDVQRARDEFLAGDRPDEVVLYLADETTEGSGLADHGLETDAGVLLVLPGDQGRQAFSAGTGVDAMTFAGQAMGTEGDVAATVVTAQTTTGTGTRPTTPCDFFSRSPRQKTRRWADDTRRARSSTPTPSVPVGPPTPTGGRSESRRTRSQSAVSGSAVSFLPATSAATCSNAARITCRVARPSLVQWAA